MQQVLEGNVVAMLASNLIMADKLSIDREKNIFKATGHVLVLSSNQVFGGDELILYAKTEDFFLQNAFLVANDSKKAAEISQRVLGITAEEVRFEVEKKRQLEIVRGQKDSLKKRFSKLAPSQRPLLINEYALLLEKEQLIAKQKNTVLAQLGMQKRDGIERRRAFWAESQKRSLSLSRPMLPGNYIKLSGNWLERTEGNHYRAQNAVVTPCMCEDDEKPAWGLRTESFDAYGEGYADLSDAVIEIKGIPILYFPYLRIPMKGERQSGFLFPNLSYAKYNGSVLSQPIFFDLGPNKDSTVTLDMIEKRGLRIGGELRYQEKTYSGWTLSGEIIRDRQWLNLQSERAELARAYNDGLSQAQAQQNNLPSPTSRTGSLSLPSLSSTGYWHNIGYAYCLDHPTAPQCQEALNNSIQAPSNQWRHKMEWQGMTFLTPRMSFVSEGKMLSDHRYLQDLYFEKFNESFSPAYPSLFSKAKGHFHLDGSDFYGGIGSAWGDRMTSDSPYSGHQVPLYARLRTRLFPLLEAPRPVYAGVLLNFKRLHFLDDASFHKSFPNDSVNAHLDSGNWTQVKFNLLTPLFKDQVFTLDSFGEFEARSIEADYRFSASNQTPDSILTHADSNSTIRTARFGLDFHLPIDGIMQLLADEDGDKKSGRFLNHRMDWGLNYSLRPSVVRKGGYADITNAYQYDAAQGRFRSLENAQSLTYFASENPQNFDSDLLPEAERMIPHQQILLSTSHDWLTYQRTWQNTRASQSEAQASGIQDFQAMAEKELSYANYLSEQLHRSLNAEDARKRGFHILESNRQTFLHVDSNIGYDFRKQQERRRLESDPVISSTNLPQPWSPWRSNASLSLYDTTLSTFAKYDIYSHLFSEMRFQLSLPQFLQSRISLGYSIEKEVSYDGLGGLLLNRTITRNYGLTSSLIPQITLVGEYDIRMKENQSPDRQYYASAGAQYSSPSQCWGMNFYWRKDFPEPTWAGTYYLSLIVKFFNYNREYGNLLSKANQSNVN